MANYAQSHTFDELDYRIIQELRANGRAEAAKIARAVDVNERTVRKRIDRLLNSGAVTVTAVVNQRAFGYVTAVFVMLEVDPASEAVVVERFRAMQEITFLAYGLGSRDLLLQACFKDNDDMREFLRHTLPSIPGVQVTATILVPRVLRNITGWTPRLEDFEQHDAKSGVVKMKDETVDSW
jgi:Lrp/AsnC family transcriptional regulator, regulator for asnA, asnC and gidA